MQIALNVRVALKRPCGESALPGRSDEVARAAAGPAGWVFLTALQAPRDSALCDAVLSAQTAERSSAGAACTLAGEEMRGLEEPGAWTEE